MWLKCQGSPLLMIFSLDHQTYHLKFWFDQPWLGPWSLHIGVHFTPFFIFTPRAISSCMTDPVPSGNHQQGPPFLPHWWNWSLLLPRIGWWWLKMLCIMWAMTCVPRLGVDGFGKSPMVSECRGELVDVCLYQLSNKGVCHVYWVVVGGVWANYWEGRQGPWLELLFWWTEIVRLSRSKERGRKRISIN